MASNDGETPSPSPPSSSHPPPPFDPFPTYQTPYPRSRHDEENPFIQFRRFADDQFQHLFAGIPHLFGFTSPESFKQEIEDMCRRRNQMEEGWRKQLEQNVEEMKQALQKDLQDSQRQAVNARQPWWIQGDASKCPALNDMETLGRAKECPAMFDKAGNPRTELDLYEHREKVEQKMPARRPGWFSGVGWDGKCKGYRRGAQVDESDGPRREEFSFTRPTKYTRFNARRIDPISNTNGTIPWLMLSTYSPIYLCNPTQPRMFKVHIMDNEGVPFQIFRPRFCGERVPSELDVKISRHIPWADAFEDLVSLHQTGRMVDRDYSTFKTPNTWIHDMVHRGSLGPKWGFNDEGKLMKCPQPSDSTFGRVLEELRQIEQRNQPMIAVVPQIWHAPEDIMSAVSTKEEEGHQAVQNALPVPDSKAFPLESSWSSSSSSSSWSNLDSNSSTTTKSDSIISSLTKTESRTLPDGSIETRRVLKRVFADGREEGEESIDVQQPSSTPGRFNKRSFPASTSRKNDRHTQTPTPVQEELKKLRENNGGRGGWFWH